MKYWIPFAITLSIGLGACSGSQEPDAADYTEAAEYAYDRAVRAYDRGDQELARELFAGVYQNYPYSQYATLAELGIADAFYEERLYARAIESYRRFIRFHPTHERVEHADFQIASAYYEQMPGDWLLMPPSYERDLSRAESAYQALGLFVSAYSETELAERAQVMRFEVLTRLAAHELYVAEFYARQDNYRAAAQRCAGLIDTYPNALQVPEALFLYAHSLIALDDVMQAAEMLDQLVTSFPDHELAGRATRYMEDYDLTP